MQKYAMPFEKDKDGKRNFKRQARLIAQFCIRVDQVVRESCIQIRTTMEPFSTETMPGQPSHLRSDIPFSFANSPFRLNVLLFDSAHVVTATALK